MNDVNRWAVSAFVLGGLWYSSALFGKPWQRETGLSDDALKRGNMPLIFGASFLLSLLAAGVFAMFIGPAPALPVALGAALAAGACWVAARFGIDYPFERRSLRLFFMNGATMSRNSSNTSTSRSPAASARGR
jgi:hypothetical protein